jgi:cyclopropane fatty-acyl-phospholipid synthase-like methyltransferase
MNEEQREGQKYDYLYEHGYPAGGPGWPIKWADRSSPDLKILDIGCGRGLLSTRYKDYTGIDVSQFVIDSNKSKLKGRFERCGALEASELFKAEQFDLAVSLDVLEHFPKDNIDAYLEGISRINAKEFLFAICCRESGYKDKDGHGLHLTVMEKDKWIEHLSKFFVVKSHSDMNRQKTFCILLEKK